MSPLGRTVAAAERTGSEVARLMLDALSRCLAPGAGGGDDALPPGAQARLQRDVAELETALGEIAAASGTGEALKSLAVAVEGVSRRAMAAMALVDTLIEEAERLYGTRAGQGAYKRQQVKAALLWAAHRGGYRLPLVPSFLEPVAFSVGTDMLIDFAVAHVNQNALWGREAASAAPAALRPRLGGPLILRLRHGIEGLAKWLAGLSWRLVLGANRLAPSLRAAAERIEAPDAALLGALGALRDFLRANPRFVTGIATLFGIATRQAELLVTLSGPQKQAYVRALIMIVLRERGLVGASPLWDRIVEGLVTAGIDATVALFNRRRLFR